MPGDRTLAKGIRTNVERSRDGPKGRKILKKEESRKLKKIFRK